MSANRIDPKSRSATRMIHIIGSTYFAPVLLSMTNSIGKAEGSAAEEEDHDFPLRMEFPV